jgi:glycosyltransferase involved in cell wall biosynthesis
VEKRVYSPRGTILEGYFTGFRRWLFIRLDRMAARWTDFIVGLTVEESNSYIEARIGRPDQHMQIPIGIDHTAFEPPDPAVRLSERRRHSVEDDEVLIVTSGRLVPVKDHATLVKSLAILSERITGWRCWILGSGPEEGRLVNLIDDLGLGDNIRLWGFRADLADLLGLGDIFVLSSTNEGFGRSLLEAMSARLAIAATSVGGVPTVLDGGNAGLLCPPSDPEALASVIHRLVESADERNRLASIGYKRVRNLFSLDGMVEEHVSLYDSLLSP